MAAAEAKVEAEQLNINDDEDIIDVFHGTEVHNLPRIMAEGLRPSVTGAGANHVQEHYGLVVPAVYVSPSFNTASYYPMQPTTVEVSIPGQRKKKSPRRSTAVK